MILSVTFTCRNKAIVVSEFSVYGKAKLPKQLALPSDVTDGVLDHLWSDKDEKELARSTVERMLSLIYSN